MLKEVMEKIFSEYQSAKKEKYVGHPLVKLIKKDFPNNLSDLTKNIGNYKVIGYPGEGKWTASPYIAILDPQITNSVESGFYVLYIFTEDGKKVYLSLNQGLRNQKGLNPPDFLEELMNNAVNIRNKLKIPEGFQTEKLTGLGSHYYFKRLESGNICSKSYNYNDLPSEEQLKTDIQEILRLYNTLSPSTEILTALSDPNEIKDSQELFKTIFTEIADEIIEAPTQSRRFPLLWSTELGIWGYFGDVENHYFNPFGIGKPDKSLDNKTVCEINSPHHGIRRTTSGVFAKNSRGQIFLLHRGTFHGFKIKKEEVDNWVEIEDGNQKSEAILIGELGEPHFPIQLKEFIFKVNQIKGGNEVDEKTFFDFLTDKGYFFDSKLVENFLLSLKVKPFVILTGNSGTGKTKVVQLFAQYLETDTNDSDLSKYKLSGEIHTKNDAKEVLSTITNSVGAYPNDQVRDLLPELIEKGVIGNNGFNILKKYEIVPVGANWTENRHILGFYNVITEDYNYTNALKLIIRAGKDKIEPHFLVLDEMNLSHVERYFSDFLSAMESDEEIELHQATTNAENNQLPPKKLKLVENLVVVGTVNVDETTYMFSPKVLDRANTLEFLTQPAEDYMSSSPQYIVNGDLNYLQDPLSDIAIRNENINELKNRLIRVQTGDGKPLWDVLSKNIGQFQKILKKAEFDFGFRTINEIIRFMCVAWQYEKKPPKWDNWIRYFDAQIMQKMLPKLHGSQKELANVLEELEDQCKKGNFSSSSKKIEKMRKTLQEKRYVAFTG